MAEWLWLDRGVKEATGPTHTGSVDGGPALFPKSAGPSLLLPIAVDEVFAQCRNMGAIGRAEDPKQGSEMQFHGAFSNAERVSDFSV
jgi:hypothetical protein